MKVIKLTKKNEKEVIKEAVKALKEGKSVVYPTDTSYALGVNALSSRAVEKLYDIKGRTYDRPVHVMVPSLSYAKKIVDWNYLSEALAKKFLPGPMTLTLPLISKEKTLFRISQSHFLGIRYPKQEFTQKLAKAFGGPITATSANPAKAVGGHDPYTIAEVMEQFVNRRKKPDLIIDAGPLRRRKPSTFVQVIEEQAAVLREGPINAKAVLKVVDAVNRRRKKKSL